MNAIVIPDVESDDPMQYISHIAKLIAVYQIYTPWGSSLWKYKVIQNPCWLSIRHQLNWSEYLMRTLGGGQTIYIWVAKGDPV